MYENWLTLRGCIKINIDKIMPLLMFDMEVTDRVCKNILILFLL